MRVLIISQFFWPESFRLNDMAVGLKENGHEVTVLTGIPNYPKGKFFNGYGYFKKKREKFKGIDIIRIPIIPRGNGGVHRLILNYLSFIISASILSPIYCRGKYDVILFSLSPFAEGVVVSLLKKIKRIPVIFWVQDLWPESLSATNLIRSKFLLNVVRWMMSRIYKNCDRVLVQSRSFKKSIEKMGVESDRISYFPNGAEELYRPVNVDDKTHSISKMPNGFRVMFAGNVGAAQGFDTILGAAEILKDYNDIHFMILGDGRMFEWVKNKVNELNLTNNVHLLGRHPMETMPFYFSKADAMLVTLRENPIFKLTVPAKIQSYLACGKPIISALDGEGSRIVQEAQAGMACSSGNPKKLAETIVSMYNISASEREKMGVNGRDYFEKNFDRKVLINKLMAIISETSLKSRT